MVGLRWAGTWHCAMVIGLWGCDSWRWVDPEDAQFFADGAPYVPQGLLCGLAYSGGYGQHMGGSCRGEYDPALGYEMTGSYFVAEGRLDATPCPDGFGVVGFSDRDSPDSQYFGPAFWSTCVGDGNALSSSASPRDLPAGAVCGLGAARSLDDDHWAISCEGVDPSTGRCPDGYDLRWIPDAFYDGTDLGGSVEPPTCLPDGSPAIDSGAVAIFFCAVSDDVGCTTADCYSPTQYEGVLCGLHARGSWPKHYLDRTERDWEHPEWIDYDSGLYDHFYHDWFEPCSASDSALAELKDLLAEPVQPPTCMGKDISDGECPAPLELVCSPGWHGTASPENVHYTAMCWCSSPGARQRLAEEDRVAPDTGAE